MRNRTVLRAALANKNVVAFLRMIRVGEGTSDEKGYNRLFGGGHFTSFDDHPRRRVTFRLGHRPISSTAAGAYQHLERTWDAQVREWGFENFSPACQDEAAVALILGRRALDDVIAGRFEIAVRKCASEWASLPGSPYGQPTKTLKQARDSYLAYGGVERPVAASGETRAA